MMHTRATPTHLARRSCLQGAPLLALVLQHLAATLHHCRRFGDPSRVVTVVGTNLDVFGRDGVVRDLVQHALHLPLRTRLVRVHLQRVEVRDAGAGHQQRREPAAGADGADILEGLELDVPRVLRLELVLQVQTGLHAAAPRKHVPEVLHTPPQSHGQNARLTHGHGLRRRATRELAAQRPAVVPQVPHAPEAVEARSRHVVVVHRHRHQGPLVRQHLHRRPALVRRPQRDSAAVVPQVDHPVVPVVPHHLARPLARLEPRHHLAVGHVLPAQLAEFPDGRQQPERRHVVQLVRQPHVAQAVHLHPVVVVHVHVLLLRHRQQLVVVEQLHVADRLLDRYVKARLHIDCVKQRQLPLFAPD
ncbi:ABC transporter ATP-binding protein [Babesia caballi]|uniref:ABC transporter ATP-binding protein n=1 Tax=Babesia caballi TaxID=5871 RepID=A0AAV4LQV8_BABCB|nr:ABC transporter ATP-binding protein [Babesia caballi]